MNNQHYTSIMLADFKISQRFIVNVHHVFACWHRVEVGCFADISEEHAASILKGDVCRVGI
jgi:hypothetical protein